MTSSLRRIERPSGIRSRRHQPQPQPPTSSRAQTQIATASYLSTCRACLARHLGGNPSFSSGCSLQPLGFFVSSLQFRRASGPSCRPPAPRSPRFEPRTGLEKPRAIGGVAVLLGRSSPLAAPSHPPRAGRSPAPFVPLQSSATPSSAEDSEDHGRPGGLSEAADHPR